MIRRRKLTGALAIMAAVVVLFPAPAVAGPARAAAAAPVTVAAPAAWTGEDGQQSWVTLMTGDRVHLSTVAGKTSTIVYPAQRAGVVQFARFAVKGDQYVVPSDASGLIRDGVLDRELFNVTGLVRQRYDDAHAATVPLLVRYAGDQPAARKTAPAGVTVRRSLPGGLSALDESKSTATGFWSQTVAPTDGTAGGARRGATVSGGIERIWLNGRVRATLDRSTAQIGAPTAWANGLTGTGMTVAVLDSGIDTDHPDFAGRVGPTSDFTGKGSVEDGLGHGTHVASIVAGSGAASGGLYKGVASGARLAVGKVLDDNGDGTMDQVLAGMYWAATESGSKIVNMSLGSYPTDGNDPMSLALNELSRDYGTLFVVSSGNYGGDATVGSPAAATDSLAVGSVGRTDVPSDFSSRGPRLGDGAVKPDLSAPGENIVAAAPGGVPPLGESVGDAYQRLDGTSMAAPHVSGAAVLLAQQYPQWTGTQLKAALMSTAAEVTGAGPYAVGTGRVDVARATTQAVTATGSVSTYLPWPNTGASKAQTVTWRNAGSSPVTLALSASLSPSGTQPTLALSSDTVTVPAGAEASIQVTMSAKDEAAGKFSGYLTARSADGAVTTRTAVAIYQEEEQYDLTVNLLDRNGQTPAPGPFPNLFVVDLDDGMNSGFLMADSPVRLPKGRYAIHGMIPTPRAGHEPSLSFVSHPEFTLDRHSVLTFKGTDAKPASITPDDPAARGGQVNISMRSTVADCACDYTVSTGLDPMFDEVFVATVPGTSSSNFSFVQSRRAEDPILEFSALTAQPFAVRVGWYSDPLPAGSGNLTAVYGGGGTAEDVANIDARGKLVVVAIPGGVSRDEVYQRTVAIRDAGATMALLTNADEVLPKALSDGDFPDVAALPTMYGSGSTTAEFVRALQTGQIPTSYVSRPIPSQRYEMVYSTQDKLTTAQVHKAKKRDLVAVQTRYYDNAPKPSHSVQAYAEVDGKVDGIAWFVANPAPAQRTEYFTPGTWTLTDQAGPSNIAQTTVHLRAGHPQSVSWNKAVAGPSLQGSTYGGPTGQRPWVQRIDGTIDATLPMFADAAGRPRVPEEFIGDTGSVSLYRDGTLVGTEPRLAYVAFGVPDAPATYKLTAEVNRATDWWSLSTKVSCVWTFRSSAADDTKAVPLLTVRFDPTVDLRNRAPGGKEFTFPAYVARQGSDTNPNATLTVDVSYDDGQTWRAAKVTTTKAGFTVSVRHPAHGYASLRAKAKDKAGNTVEQTITRAYAIG